MFWLALTLALQTAPCVSLRALLAAPPAGSGAPAVVDILLGPELGPQGRAPRLVLRRAEGGERLADWTALAGGSGAWQVRVPVWPEPARALPEVEPPATDRADFSALFASTPPAESSGVVQSVEHERTPDGREFASLRVQVEAGDLVRVALGPSGWHARGASVPDVGQLARLRAVPTRDERGLLWIAASLRAGDGPELRVRRDDGSALWPALGEAPWSTSCAALLGRRVTVRGRTQESVEGHVDDVLLERGTDAPRITLVIRRGAGGGPPVLLPWQRASVEGNGALSVTAEDWARTHRPTQAGHPRASGSAVTGPTRIGDARGRAWQASFPGSPAVHCRRP